VHSGEAFVGVIGSDERLDFTALGDTVNVAARLGGVAGPGEVLVTAVGWDHAPRDLAPVERGPITVQGRTEPLEVVRLRIGLEAAVP
jgi:adenylate cyclase